jgi:phage baseplate assembly protein W
MIAISYPFRVRGGVRTTTNYDQVVRGQLIDAVATNQGERLMNPNWGCNLRAKLFDPSDSLVQSDVAGQIARSLPNFVPRSQITRTNLAVSPGESNLVTVDIGYRTSSYAPEVSLSMPIETDTVSNLAGSDVST